MSARPYDPKDTALAVAIGGQQKRCACCSSLGASAFCPSCRRHLLCGECGHCAEHCSCPQPPRCTACAPE